MEKYFNNKFPFQKILNNEKINKDKYFGLPEKRIVEKYLKSNEYSDNFKEILSESKTYQSFVDAEYKISFSNSLIKGFNKIKEDIIKNNLRNVPVNFVSRDISNNSNSHFDLKNDEENIRKIIEKQDIDIIFDNIHNKNVDYLEKSLKNIILTEDFLKRAKLASRRINGVKKKILNYWNIKRNN